MTVLKKPYIRVSVMTSTLSDGVASFDQSVARLQAWPAHQYEGDDVEDATVSGTLSLHVLEWRERYVPMEESCMHRSSDNVDEVRSYVMVLAGVPVLMT